MSTISERVRALHKRFAGTKIRHQTVESVEIAIDSNGPDGTLRYFIFVWFKEPELPQNMRDELKLLRRVFWNTDSAQVLLSESEFELVLDGAMEIPVESWILSDELRD
jgi:hypothetical protein